MAPVVLITGASRGIGAACATLFAKEGYRVAVHYNKNRDSAENIANLCGGIAVCADISDSNQVNQMIDEIESKLGNIDILINNAGIAEDTLITDVSDDAWRMMLGVNLSGSFYTARRVLPNMISKKAGCIINISSMWGQVGASCEVAYSTAKAGLIGFTKALAKEVAPSGIRVNAISPGVIKTDMLNCYNEADISALIEETPLSRLGTPEDIANAALFLASDKASFITGQIIGVNGGFVI
ncbi:MAG: 3-oxoacyl-ACP reductase FabG [Clostridia bacterium]|nr:3-oxoacyl-ACP reductase FabG [Clostridia bacterium]